MSTTKVEWTVSPAAYDFLQRVRSKAIICGEDPDEALSEMLGLLTEEIVSYWRLIEIVEDEAKEIENYIRDRVLLNG